MSARMRQGAQDERALEFPFQSLSHLFLTASERLCELPIEHLLPGAFVATGAPGRSADFGR